MTFSRRRTLVAALGATAIAASLVGCTGPSDPTSTDASGGGASCSNTIVHPDAPQVSLWGWYPNINTVVDLYNNAHTDVQVCWSNAGQGADEYAKFSTAIAAGSGAPDVVMLEAEVLPQFEIQKALLDLSQYGAKDVVSTFSAGAIKDVSSGDAIYAAPVDGGPMAMMYRKDIFDKYGITTPPATWAEYAADAQKIKDAGGPVMGDFGSNVPAWLTALMNQKGQVPFDYNLTDQQNIGIKLNDDNSKDVMNYWQDLIKKGLVGTQDQFNTDYISGIIGGTYATYISAAWAPGYLTGAGAGEGADKGTWAVAPLPQWDASKPVQVNWGGSTFAATTQAKDPALAAKVALSFYASADEINDGVTTGTIFPLSKTVLDTDAFASTPVKFFDGQTANKDVYIPAAADYKGFTYSPFTTYYYSELTKEMLKVISGESTGSQALDDLQATMTDYAKSQGFTVK